MVRPDIKKKIIERANKIRQSHKERKQIEKTKLKKQSRLNRASLLAELKKCQLDESQFSLLHSTTSMQTKGLKKFVNHREPDSSISSHLITSDITNERHRWRNRNLTPQVKDIDSSEDDTDNYSDDSNSCSSETTEIYGVNESHSIEPVKQVPQPTRKKITITARKPQPATYVIVNRKQDVIDARSRLPIIGEEQEIMENIRYNDVVIISGETGSGKTTQIPQFLFEAGYALDGKIIGVTEPRRVAAIAMSERVGYELNLPEQVSYQIRFHGTVSNKTRIKFMTDGVLMKECQNDLLLSKYSVIIIDEAHERSIFSDILIGLLSRIVTLRRNRNDILKLIIMSATLRVSDFSENKFLFKKSPPILEIDSRQYPVTIKFAKKTPDNYLQSAYKKINFINEKLPKGGILVFVTSQLEVKYLCDKLRLKSESNSSPLTILGLYAMMPIDEQKKVFRKSSHDVRLCVISTNVAETSITIPNIRYVIDCGKEKSRIYNLVTGVSRFQTNWTSKASAEQRSGRAGRVGPGTCYRLYSSSVYLNDFPQFSQPKILQKPVEDVLLQMKAMNIDNVVNFPFPSQPPIDALEAAEHKLILLDALDSSKLQNARFNELKKIEFTSRPTNLGLAMSKLAVGVRCSKMIVLSPNDLVGHTIALVAAMSVRELFIDPKKANHLSKNCLLGDYMKMIRVMQMSEIPEKLSAENLDRLGLHRKSIMEAIKLRKQLLKEYKSHFVNITESKLVKLTDDQIKLMRQLLFSSFCDQVARRVPDGEIKVRSQADPNIFEVKKVKNAYECLSVKQLVYISQDSCLKDMQPEYVIYRELHQDSRKTYMRDVVAIDPCWFPFYAPKLCRVSTKKTVFENPRLDRVKNRVVCCRDVQYGSLNWKLGMIDVPIEMTQDKEMATWKARNR